MKNCKHCKKDFEILKADEDFYQKMGVLSPTLCYICRMQRRLSYRNERFLYHRKCDLTGKQIISSFSTDKPFPVYDVDAWWEDTWDPTSYGREFDFNKPFFPQWEALRNSVPRLALQQQKPIENSSYCNCVSRNKNCYLVFSTNFSEDCYYGSWVNYSTNCIDNSYINHTELCYECVDCANCYHLKFALNCTNCKDSMFMKNCQGCSNCFGCYNLINKSYYIFNEQKTKEEYESFMKNLNLGSYKNLFEMRDYFNKITKNLIVKEFQGVNNENSIGNYIYDSKDLYYCFDCDKCDDLRYSMCVTGSKSCMDYSYWGQNCELMYECQACGYECNNLKFCNLCWQSCSDLTYCDQCFSCQDCFGCVGLKKKKYCIFNKQYTRDEYTSLKEQIIKHMKTTGEWGEFFPSSMSNYAYNETLAYEQIPLAQSEIESKGWIYKDLEKENAYVGARYEIPDDIKYVDDAIVKLVLQSEISGKPYKVIPQELAFLKRENLPIPRLTPDERHWERLKKRNPRKIFSSTCMKCKSPVKTTYAKDRPEIVYCEKCYRSEVY